jgi:GT2 family glycosyltransferase
MSLSVVIGAVGNVDLTQRCVDSVRALSSLPTEIVLVDNGSTPEESDKLARLGADVLLHYPMMIGYPGAMNAGAAAASGQYLCLLNNDAAVTQRGWDARLVSVLEAVQDAAIVAPMTDRVAHPGQRADGPQAASPQDLLFTDALHFVCVLMRRALYVELGGLDERFGLGNFEDIDFSHRVIQGGGKLLIDPGVWVRHECHATMRRLDFGELLATNQRKYHEKWSSNGAENFDPQGLE